jgi:hypothetical protein
MPDDGTEIASKYRKYKLSLRFYILEQDAYIRN